MNVLRIIIVSFVTTFLFYCDQLNVSGERQAVGMQDNSFTLVATPSRYFNGHTGAVSITFDIPVPVCNDALEEAISRSVAVDVEFITSLYTIKDKAIFRDIESYSSRGIHFFGHGHRHDINYDAVSYQIARSEFDTCFRLMKEWNLSPLVYAYPGGCGRTAIPQRAASDAGYICARGVHWSLDSVFVCADGRTTPDNWYNLPAVCIGALPGWVQNHAGMVEVFDRNIAKKSWLIPMYHAIGEVNGYAFYPMEDFKNDLDYLLSTDTWIANMDVVARYIMERNSCRMEWKTLTSTDEATTVEAVFADSLKPTIEPVPLTMQIEIAGARSFYRCEVTDTNDITTDYRVIDNRFSINIVPDEQVVRMKFFTKDNE